ncbi:hypothetical protein FF1_035378 [Malus domestica]
MDNQGWGNLAADATAKLWCMGAEGSVKKGFVEALYFTVVTITIVGYGDYVPNTWTAFRFVSSANWTTTGGPIFGLPSWLFSWTVDRSSASPPIGVLLQAL